MGNRLPEIQYYGCFVVELYNHGRPHKSLGPGIPAPPPGLPVNGQIPRHEVPEGFLIKKKSILGGLHHEYRLEKVAA